MLDVANGKDENGANIQIYNAGGHAAQQFVVKETKTKGVYTIATKASGDTKVLDVYEKKTDDGTNVCQWAYNGNANQQWIFEKANGSTSQESTGKTNEPAPSQETPAPTPAPSSSTKADGLDVSYTINNWGSGYSVNLKLDNKTGKNVNGWTVKVKKSEINITSSWNMTVKTSGDYYVITPVDWNQNIANGQSVDIGFVGSGSVGNSINFTVE